MDWDESGPSPYQILGLGDEGPNATPDEIKKVSHEPYNLMKSWCICMPMSWDLLTLLTTMPCDHSDLQEAGNCQAPGQKQGESKCW